MIGNAITERVEKLKNRNKKSTFKLFEDKKVLLKDKNHVKRKKRIKSILMRSLINLYNIKHILNLSFAHLGEDSNSIFDCRILDCFIMRNKIIKEIVDSDI